jgi:hypothetical protein
MGEIQLAQVVGALVAEHRCERRIGEQDAPLRRGPEDADRRQLEDLAILTLGFAQRPLGALQGGAQLRGRQGGIEAHASNVSRTLRIRPSGEKGFCRKAFPRTSVP